MHIRLYQSHLCFVVDELHIQWEIILENETKNSLIDGSARENHDGPQTTAVAVKSATNQQVFYF